jgi:hypothetical protein
MRSDRILPCRRQRLHLDDGRFHLSICEGEAMADKEWTVKELMEALKRFPLEAKVYYEMGPNGPATAWKGAIR